VNNLNVSPKKIKMHKNRIKRTCTAQKNTWFYKFVYFHNNIISLITKCKWRVKQQWQRVECNKTYKQTADVPLAGCRVPESLCHGVDVGCVRCTQTFIIKLFRTSEVDRTGYTPSASRNCWFASWSNMQGLLLPSRKTFLRVDRYLLSVQRTYFSHPPEERYIH
jgi:hypothetical protein